MQRYGRTLVGMKNNPMHTDVDDFWNDDKRPDRADHHFHRFRLVRPVTLLAVLAGALALAFAVGAIFALLPSGKPAGAAASAPHASVGAPAGPGPKWTPSGRLFRKPKPSVRTIPKPKPVIQPSAKSTSSSQPSTPPARSVNSTTAAPVRLSLTSDFDNVGITSDSNPTIGNLDGSTSAFSAQALAAAGARPGATVTSHGVPFTWPDVAAGTPDNVTASGQVLPASGAGRTLSFLVTAGWGPASGGGAVVYADGSAQKFTIGAPDWFRNCPSASGPDVALFTPYRNQGNGHATFHTCVYYASVRLHAGKNVMKIILPDLSTPVPGPGAASLHIFAATIH